MARRYAYWKTPEGRPYRNDDGKEDGKYERKALLAEIGQSAALKANGDVVYPIDVHRFNIALQSSLVIVDQNGDTLTDADSIAVLRRAKKSVVVAQGGETSIPPKALLRAIDAEVSEFCRKPVEEFELLSSLSIEKLPTKNIKIGNCQISSVRRNNSKYGYPTSLERMTSGTPFGEHLESTKYQAVKVKTAGRSFQEATRNSLNALSLLRSYWSLFADYRSWRIGSGNMQLRPVGEIHQGPIHTLHTTDGASASEFFWYEPDYMTDARLFSPRCEWPALEKMRRRAMGKVARLLYRKDLERLLIRYAEALGNANLDVAFLQMWNILETITDTVGSHYDDTIKRVTWIYDDRALSKDILQSLRCHRNQFVHSTTSSEQRDQIAYLIKSFVDPHLLRLIDNEFRVKSIREYGRFLGHPADVGELAAKYESLGRALRWQKTSAPNPNEND